MRSKFRFTKKNREVIIDYLGEGMHRKQVALKHSMDWHKVESIVTKGIEKGLNMSTKIGIAIAITKRDKNIIEAEVKKDEKENDKLSNPLLGYKNNSYWSEKELLNNSNCHPKKAPCLNSWCSRTKMYVGTIISLNDRIGLCYKVSSKPEFNASFCFQDLTKLDCLTIKDMNSSGMKVIGFSKEADDSKIVTDSFDELYLAKNDILAGIFEKRVFEKVNNDITTGQRHGSQKDQDNHEQRVL